MRPVLITGATGYIGRHLAKVLAVETEVHVLVRNGSDVSSLSAHPNIKLHFYNGNYAEMKNALAIARPDTVFHLAANQLYEHSGDTIDVLLNTNITMGTHLLEAMKEADCHVLINTGTYWQHQLDEIYSPACLYAATKQAFEAIVEFYTAAHNFRVITLLLFDVYGPNDPRKKILTLLYEAAVTKEVVALSPGQQKLNLVYIDDVVDAYRQARNILLESSKSGHQRFYITGEQTLSLKELVSLYETLLGKKIPLQWGGKPYKKMEVMNPWTGGQSLPGWRAKIDLAKGLQQIISSQS